MKSKHLSALLLILIIASFLRLYHITMIPPGLYPDEAMNGNNALQALRTAPPAGGFKVFYPENNGREGLFINIQAVFLKFFDADSPLQISQGEKGEIREGKPWVLRFPSAIFGILTVLGLYFLAKELFEDTISFSPKPRSQPGLVSDTQSDQAGEDKRVSRWNERSGLRKNEIVALLSSFLLATSFWHINFSRIGFRAIMAPFLLTWALYLFIKAFKNDDTAAVQPRYRLPLLRPSDGVQFRSKRNWKNFIPALDARGFSFERDKNAICYMPYAICAGIIYGLGFYTYIAYRVTPVLILFILLFFWLRSKKENWRKKFYAVAWVFLTFAFLTTLPLAAYFLTHRTDFLGRTSQISVFSSEAPLKDLGTNILKTLGMFNVRGDSNWRHNYSDRPELFWPVGIMFLIGIVLGIKTLWQNLSFGAGHSTELGRSPLRPSGHGSSQSGESKAEAPAKVLAGNLSGSQKTNFAFSVLFLWFMLALLPVVISNEGLPHALRSILMIPPLFMFAGVGGVVTYDFLKKRITSFWLPLASTIFLFLLVFEAYNTYFILWAKNSNTYGAFSADYVELGKALNGLPANVPKYVVAKAGGVLVNGIPMPAQTVMFVTDTYSPKNQQLKNIHYLLPNQENTVPSGAKKFYIE